MVRRFLILCTVILIGLFLWLTFQQGRAAERQVIESTRDQCLRQVKLLAENVSKVKRQDVSSWLTRFRSLFPSGQQVMLLDRQGIVLASYPPADHSAERYLHFPEIQDALTNGVGIQTRVNEEDVSWLFVTAASQDSTSEVGFVHLSTSLKAADQAREDVERAILLTLLVALVILGVLCILLFRRLFQPVRELTQHVKDWTAGRTSLQTPRAERAEVVELIGELTRKSESVNNEIQGLESEQQQLHAILSGMVEGVIAVDSEERILFVNERACHLLDMRQQNPIGRKLWTVVRQRALLDVYQRARAESLPQQEELNWYGSEKRSLKVHAARLGGSSAGGAVLVLHDTTELRRLERMRQDFVANVSHELKTPLAVIQPCVETLLGGALEEPEHARRFLQQIADQSDRLLRLILDLLSLARTESGAELFSFQKLELAELLPEIVNRYQSRAEAHEQILKIETIDPDALILADEEAISEIVENLIDNALKYTPEGGSVTVSCHSDRGQVSIKVRDTGIGIPPSDLPRIFERFYRVDKARSREMGGTGLGLSIVKHLVQAMHGLIDIKSELNKGTELTVTFPHLRTGAQR